ncbi:MAG: hypothetical protein OHK0028_00890 [Deltaproteobacteria bacterium]
MRSGIRKFLWVPLLIGSFAGCAGLADTRQDAESPRARAIAARTEAVESARISFREATAAGSELAAPFEFYMAQEYLDLAEHELNAGDKEGVVLFAEKSKMHSVKAMEIARGGSK